MDHSESIPTKKKFSTKNFCLCHFFDLWPNFSKKWLRKVTMGKNFRNRDFRFKIRFRPFWIDSEKKFFSKKFSKIFDFFFIFCPKSHVCCHLRIFPGRNQKMSFGWLFKLFITVILSYQPLLYLERAHFYEFFLKKHVFRRFLGQKIFFEKNFLFHLVVLIITKILSYLPLL